MENDKMELYEYLHFDEEDPIIIEHETKEIQHSNSIERNPNQKDEKKNEEENSKRIKEIEKLTQEMTSNSFEQLKKELLEKQRESQKPTMYIPIITNLDYAAIFWMEKINDPKYIYSRFLDVDVWRRKINKSTWTGVAKGIIKNITPERMSQLYWNYDQRKKWDTFYTIIDDLEYLPSGNKVSRTATWVPKMFTQRDYIHVRDVIETKETCIGVYLPAEHEKAPIGMNGYIRGYVNISGYIFRKQGNDCLCTLMTQTDISIPVPDFLIAKFISIAVSIYIRAMRKAAKEYGKK